MNGRGEEWKDRGIGAQSSENGNNGMSGNTINGMSELTIKDVLYTPLWNVDVKYQILHLISQPSIVSLGVGCKNWTKREDLSLLINGLSILSLIQNYIAFQSSSFPSSTLSSSLFSLHSILHPSSSSSSSSSLPSSSVLETPLLHFLLYSLVISLSFYSPSSKEFQSFGFLSSLSIQKQIENITIFLNLDGLRDILGSGGRDRDVRDR